MEDSPFGHVQRRSEPPDLQVDVERMLAERTPDFALAAEAVTFEQLALVAQVASDIQTHESVRLLFNLAVNDFRDLLHDLSRGAGRSAMRAARGVIEHAINLHTVTSSLREATRYMEHLDQGAALMMGLAPGESRLPRRRRSAYLHALRKVGRPAERRFELAREEHGTWFARGWSATTLRVRAEQHGVAHLYDYYKLASLVTHGSAGGALGSVRDHPEGFRIFRTGPALELAPVAMWSGVAGYREVLAALGTVRDDLQLDGYSGALSALDALWKDYFEAMTDIDDQLWPKERVLPPIAVLTFTQTKRRRWFLHLPMHGCLVPAQEPTLEDWVEEQVAGLIDMAVSEHAHLFRADQRWLTAAISHVTVRPDHQARPIPDTALFEAPPDNWDVRRMGD